MPDKNLFNNKETNKMPRYKYSCKNCKLRDVKKFEYHKTINKSADEFLEVPVCTDCGSILELQFVNPPKKWFGGQVTSNNES